MAQETVTSGAAQRSMRAPAQATRPHPVDEVLPAERLAVYGFQHVLAFYAGAVVVPILLAGAIGLSNEQLVRLINADLFTCGIASIIQSVGIWKIGVRLPLIQGVTFTAVAPMIAIGLANGGGISGLQAIYGAVIVAGVVTFLLAPYTGRLLHLFPPVVTGTVITVIGVTLVPVAALEAGGGNPAAADFGSVQNIAFAGGTLLVILLIYRFFRGFLSTVAVLLGLIVGTAVAAAFGLVDFAGVQQADWLGLTTPLYFGAPTFGPAAVISMVVVMLITAVETTGDVFAAGEIVGKRVGREDVSRAIRADGLATTLGGILNSFPYTCFAENVGLVRLTRVKSRYVVATAGGIMVVIGLIPKIGAVVASVPHAVLGGAALILFATVAVIGFQTLSRVDFHDERNVVIVATSVALAMVPVAFPTFYKNFPAELQIVVGSGITTGSLAALLLNIVFNIMGKRPAAKALQPHAPRLTIEQVNRLDQKTFVETFSRLFQDGAWLAEQAFSRLPVNSLADLRRLLQEAVFRAEPERQLELMASYPNLGQAAETDEGAASLGLSTDEYEAIKVAAVGGVLSPESVRDQSAAGLDRLSPDEYAAFRQLTAAYREKFGFPLIIAARGKTKQEILESGQSRMDNSRPYELASGLVEIGKIADFRLRDIVEVPATEAHPA